MFDSIKNLLGNTSANTRIVSRNMLESVFVRGIGLLVSFLITPVYSRFLQNDTVLGVWFTVVSLLEWILTFDLGIGNGLRNLLAKAYTRGQVQEEKRLISSAYFVISSLALLLVIAASVAIPRLPWNSLLNISQDIISSAVLGRCVLILGIGMLVRFVLQLITSVFFAIQKSSLSNLLFVLTNIILFILISFGGQGNVEERLCTLAWINIFAYNSPMLVATIILFCGKLADSRPSLRFVTVSHMKAVFSLGGAFFLLQVLGLLIGATNEYLINLFYAPANVVDYKIYYKIFSLVSICFSLLLTPMWSMITKAYVERDYGWLKKAYRMLILLGAAATVCEFIMIFCFNFINRIWLQESAVVFSFPIALSFALMGSISIWNTVLGTVANGIGELKTQAICYICGVVLKLLTVFLLRQLGCGWYAVVISNAVALVPYCILEPKHIRRLLGFQGRIS